MIFLVTGNTVKLQDGLNLLREVNPLDGHQRHSLRPFCPLLDPGAQQPCLVPGQGLAFGRHFLLIVRRQNRRGVKRTLVGFAGNQRRAVVSALYGARFGVQTQMAFGFLRPVASDAVHLK